MLAGAGASVFYNTANVSRAHYHILKARLEVENPDDCGPEIELHGPVPRPGGEAGASAWYTFSLCQQAGCRCSTDKQLKQTLSRRASSSVPGEVAPAASHLMRP